MHKFLTWKTTLVGYRSPWIRGAIDLLWWTRWSDAFWPIYIVVGPRWGLARCSESGKNWRHFCQSVVQVNAPVKGKITEVRFGQLLCTWTQVGTLGPDEPKCLPHTTQIAQGHEIREINVCGCREHTGSSRGGEKGRVVQNRRVFEGLFACFQTSTSGKGNGSLSTTSQYLNLLKKVSSSRLEGHETRGHGGIAWTDYIWRQGLKHIIRYPCSNFGTW